MKIGLWSNAAEISIFSGLARLKVTSGEDTKESNEGIQGSNQDGRLRAAFFRRAMEEWADARGLGEYFVAPTESGDYHNVVVTAMVGPSKLETLNSLTVGFTRDNSTGWSWDINSFTRVRMSINGRRLHPNMYKSDYGVTGTIIDTMKYGYRYDDIADSDTYAHFSQLQNASDENIIESYIMKANYLMTNSWAYRTWPSNALIKIGHFSIHSTAYAQLCLEAGWGPKYNQGGVPRTWAWGPKQRVRDFVNNQFKTFIWGPDLDQQLRSSVPIGCIWYSSGPADTQRPTVSSLYMTQEEGFCLDSCISFWWEESVYIDTGSDL
jgi:hypothetical protein